LSEEIISQKRGGHLKIVSTVSETLFSKNPL